MPAVCVDGAAVHPLMQGEFYTFHYVLEGGNANDVRFTQYPPRWHTMSPDVRAKLYAAALAIARSKARRPPVVLPPHGGHGFITGLKPGSRTWDFATA